MISAILFFIFIKPNDLKKPKVAEHSDEHSVQIPLNQAKRRDVPRISFLEKVTPPACAVPHEELNLFNNGKGAQGANCIA
jgi:hypothetical protein